MNGFISGVEALCAAVIGFAIGWIVSGFRSAHRLSALRMEQQSTEQELRRQTAQILEISQQRSSALARLEYLHHTEKALDESRQSNAQLQATISELKQQQASLETEIRKERQAAEEKIALLEQLRSQMELTFKSLSTAVLKENNQSFLELAHATLSNYLEGARKDFTQRRNAIEDIIVPVKEALNRYDQHIQVMELSREKAYGSLSQQVVSLMKTQDDLQKETGKLVKALRLPHVRGRWGEMTLKRVAELSGMSQYCDFELQASSDTDDGKIRPDMIVHLPGNRQLVIDAKAPLSAYLDALEAPSEQERDRMLTHHARQLQSHIQKLSQKAYWSQFHPMPEFVVLFLPGENFFSAALEQNPQLIDEGVRKNVILATPTTLISLLKTVAFGWSQEAMAESAKAICLLGRELYERLCSMTEHINRLGREIDRCSQSYNRLIGSFENRVLPSARKFNEYGITAKTEAQLSAVKPIEITTRGLHSISTPQLMELDCLEDMEPGTHEKKT